MEKTLEKTLNKFIEPLNMFLKGETAARVGEAPGGPALEALRSKVNEILDHAEKDNETFHRMNMCMAEALTDWFEALNQMKAGNLEAHVSAQYGDEFLDQLGKQLNDTLSAMKVAEQQRERTDQRKAEALLDWSSALDEVKSGHLNARVSARYDDEFLDRLGAQINDILGHVERDNEVFHRTNMAMADALTDWFEVLSEAKAGNLDARVSTEYGDDFLDQLSVQLNDTLSTLKVASEETTRQRRQIDQQQTKLIQELSTPIIQVWDQVLALPVIGIVDSQRAQEMMEKLLESVVSSQAQCVIIDLTGVTMIDTKTADYLIKMVKASTLVGSRCIITGIGPVVAQTITRMGLDLQGIVTLRDLRDGLKRAFQDMGLEFREKKG